MLGVTRRKFIGMMVGLIAVITWISGCCSLKRLLKMPCEEDPAWKTSAKEFWAARVKERKAQRDADRKSGKRPDVKTPYPYLKCIAESSRGWLSDQFKHIPLNQWSDVSLTVINRGNAASWSCHVEMYEGPWANYHMKYSDLRLVSRTITSVLPGQKKEIVMRWQATRPINGSVVTRCYDPILDPGASTYEQFDRQTSGFSWSQWIGG